MVKSAFLMLGAAIAFTGPAHAQVMSFGTSLGESCYWAAKAKSSRIDDIALCTDALEQEPLPVAERSGTLVNRGILHMYRGQLDRAQADFLSARQLDPEQAEAYLNEAILALRQERTEDALLYVDRSITLETTRPDLAYYVRGIANEILGNVPQAYRDLKMAQAIAPNWSKPTERLQHYSVVRN